MRITRVLIVLACAALASSLACRKGASEDEEHAAPRPAVNQAPTPPTAAHGVPRVLFLGDSLTAGLHLDKEESFPAILGRRLADEGLAIEVVNAGVSGDTSAGGLSRVDWLLKQSPDVVVVGLGANDGLRALSVDATRANLRQIVERVKAHGAKVLLLGMKLPPNYGVEYVKSFESIYPELSRELDVPLVPFLLEGVGGVADLNLGDGMHPNARGQEKVAENVLPALRDLLR